MAPLKRCTYLQLGSFLLIIIALFFVIRYIPFTNMIARNRLPKPFWEPLEADLAQTRQVRRIQNLLHAKERSVKQELMNYPWPSGMNSSWVIPKYGGNPIRAMILTTWRSGSTFLGDVLKSHPATYYHYEPLIHFGIHQIRSGPKAHRAQETLEKLLKCNYSNLDAYFTYAQKHHETFAHNERVWNSCQRGKEQSCWNPQFWGSMCKLFPFQVIKTVRVRANLIERFLEQSKSLNLRILLLVRDPRGTMQSRTHRVWCPGNPDCEDPAMLCSDLVNDYKTAQHLTKRVIRYEDFAANPEVHSKEILKFVGFQSHAKIDEFLKSHTNANIGGVSSTFRDSKTAPYHWKKDLSFDVIQTIQGKCQDALNLWGYRTYANESQLLNLHSVMPFVLK
ncbi:carbohydrate sulfotransferase 1-like isoform X2 [Tigriopus californicus]|uniref:carbohydrate sulfotransferase 1-like isoform X2 n=1 Tax=Tigriopus californicus TaxID=6832 RepID=UPI0027DA8327|nr:carbohydrate sulfotransferase 1-like isoform X2 [Tigriopus californicus]